MVCFAAGFFEDAPRFREDDGVGCDDEGGVRNGGWGGGEGGLVDGNAFLVGGLEDVFEGRQGLGEVFGSDWGEDFEVRESDLV